jgi:hypothetical protein
LQLISPSLVIDLSRADTSAISVPRESEICLSVQGLRFIISIMRWARSPQLVSPAAAEQKRLIALAGLPKKSANLLRLAPDTGLAQ